MSAPASHSFSVIIPTLQRAEELHRLVQQCADHDLVHEVLVINNASAPLSWPSGKVRVLQQKENIYVNPAWNLGVREATGKYIAILNDDIEFNDLPLRLMRFWLSTPFVGLIGIHRSCFDGTATGPAFLCPAYHRPRGYGIAMFLRRDNYVPVPESMLIWYGDDWLFSRQRRRNWTLRGTPIRTEMSVTSSDPALGGVIAADKAAAEDHGVFIGVQQARYGRERRALDATLQSMSALRRRVSKDL